MRGAEEPVDFDFNNAYDSEDDVTKRYAKFSEQTDKK